MITVSPLTLASGTSGSFLAGWQPASMRHRASNVIGTRKLQVRQEIARVAASARRALCSPSTLSSPVGLTIPHKSGSRFSIPTGLYPLAQGCEPRATLGCVPGACSTLKGLQRGAGSPRALVGWVGCFNPFRVDESLRDAHPG